MKDFSRQPSKTEQLLAIVLSAIATLVLGLGAGLMWAVGPSTYIIGGLFTVLFVASAVLLFRAVRTAPRALNAAESNVLAWALLLAGVIATIAALLAPGSRTDRLLVLGPGLSFLAAGLVGVRRPGR